MTVSATPYLLLHVGRDGRIRRVRAVGDAVVPPAFSVGALVLDGDAPAKGVAPPGAYDVAVLAADDGDYDVIVRDRTAEALARAELDLFTSALRHLDRPLMISESSDDIDGRRIVFTNPAFQRMVDRSEAELSAHPRRSS